MILRRVFFLAWDRDLLAAQEIPSLPLFSAKNSRCNDTIQYVHKQYDKLVKVLRSGGGSVIPGWRSSSSILSGIRVSHAAISVSGVVPQRTPRARSRCCRCHHNRRRPSVSTGSKPSRAPSRCMPSFSALRIVRPMSENKLCMLSLSIDAA
jgi:hypothetical protein